MSKKRNAGRRAARANMAYLHREANSVLKLDKALDNFIEKKHNELNDSMDRLLPLAGKSKIGRTLGLSFGLNPMFGVQLMDPRAIAGISSIDTGRKSSKEPDTTIWGTPRIDSEGERVVGMNAAFGKPYGVPPLFAPRDNGHRQSVDDLEKLEQLISESTYTIPISIRDKFERPDWGSDVQLIDGRHPDAGEWGKLCYRTACQRPYAFFYNSGTYKHYCQKCADAIDRENMGGFKLHHLAEFEGQPATA